MADMDYRTEEQKVAAVQASMSMSGHPMNEETITVGRRILRGELTADEAVLEVLKQHGYGSTIKATELRRRHERKVS